jgi:DNA-directed RNA polymerase subunit RPC12/RpoP
MVMEYCPQCGNKLNENSNFCPKCGSKLSIGEESIDTQNKEDVLFDRNKLFLNDKSKCIRCNIVFETGYYEIEERHIPSINKYGIGNRMCQKCFDELTPKVQQVRQPGEIRCPFCDNFFSPHSISPTSTTGNIARGVAFLPWGIVSAVKNKPFIRCPHCGMKIMQG